uniref:AIMP2 thioredoxin-like domain-containing protein n=1 Tax=Ciona savignyi TaxID=51511 RepID=H2ZQ13_CIOSA
MFASKPHYQFDSSNVQLSDVMYKASQLSRIQAVTCNGHNGLDENNVPAELIELKQRQDALLSTLDDMMKRMEKLKTKNPMQINTGVGNGTIQKGVLTDIVIHASPKNPPLSLKYLVELLRQKFKVLTKVHNHSSVKNPNLSSFLPNEESTNRNNYDIVVTLIWKTVSNYPVVVLNPSSTIPISGESNIARLISRILTCYDHKPENLASTASADVIYDICDVINNNGSAEKLKNDAIRTLGGILSKNKWFLGNSPTCVDAVVFSTLQNGGMVSHSALGNWIKYATTVMG